MTIKINQELCARCGLCMDECPSDAISISNGWAVVDQKRCTGCEICVEVCPNGAIEVCDEQPKIEIIPGQQAVRKPIPLQGQVLYPAPVSSVRKLAPIAAAALAYMGREVMPRFIDVVVSAIENKVSRTAEHENISLTPGLNPQINRERGSGRQIRYRGGRGNFKNRKGRR